MKITRPALEAIFEIADGERKVWLLQVLGSFDVSKDDNNHNSHQRGSGQ